mgnify:FL=1
MQSFWDLVNELDISKNYIKLQDEAVAEIISRFDTKVSEANKGTGSFRRADIFRDKSLVLKTKRDLSSKLKNLLDICMLKGYSNDENRVQCIKRDEAVLIESCLKSLYTQLVDQKVRLGYERVWVHSPVVEDGAVTELSTYIVNARIKISMWLRRYMQEHPLQCYHRIYIFSDALDFVDWKEFMDTASNLLLRLAILIQGTAEGTEGYVNFIVDSRIERYTARFLLQYLKDELGIRVFNRVLPSTLEAEVADKYNKYFSDMHFSTNFEENYTKEVLNLSSLDILNDKGTLGLEQEILVDAVSYEIVVKGSNVDRNEELLRRITNGTKEL